MTTQNWKVKGRIHVFFMSVDAYASRQIHTELPCSTFERDIRAMATTPATKAISNRLVSILCAHTTTVSMATVRTFIDRVYHTKRTSVPLRGFIRPRIPIQSSHRGWFEHPEHGWLMPASKVQSLRVQAYRRKVRHVHWGLVFGLVCVVMLGCVVYASHLARHHHCSHSSPQQPIPLTQTDIDQQFLHARPPTTDLRNIGSNKVLVQYSQMPNTTDLMRDFTASTRER